MFNIILVVEAPYDPAYGALNKNCFTHCSITMNNP